MSKNIQSFRDLSFVQTSITKRCNGYSNYKNVIFQGRNEYYPNVLLYDESKTLINPYDEMVMSLGKTSFYDDNVYNGNIVNYNFDDVIVKTQNISNPVLFFVYNFDNYYHFLYDTLPYLNHYNELKKEIPDLKLLVQYPNKDKNEFYQFNNDFLNKLVDPSDTILHMPGNIYSNMYVGTSFTHGNHSNEPPDEHVYDFFLKMYKTIDMKNINEKYLNIKKMYVSRRSHKNTDTSNIGTNYTSRRKMINEDEIVNMLTNNGFVEVFTEHLNVDEKIFLFYNCTHIVGSIGGGMANLLFSTKQTKSFVIVSPFFMDINSRFRYSMDNTNISYLYNTEVHKDNNSNISLFCRVQIIDDKSQYLEKIGEIVKYIKDDIYLITVSNNDIAGFNNVNQLQNIEFSEKQFKLLDHGLNSPYILINMLELENKVID